MNMNRRYIPAVLIMSLIASLMIACSMPERAAAASGAGTAKSAAQSSSSDAEYTEKEVKVFDNALTRQTAALRFYSSAPNVAYMGVSDYFDLMLGGGLKVTDQGGGRYKMTASSGASAVADTVRHTISSADMPAFENYLDPAMEGHAGAFKDSEAPYLRLRKVVYEDKPRPVEFDLGSLGIKVYGDGKDVWLPVSILSSWLTDIAQNRVVYNGKYLYICRDQNGYSMDQTFFDTDYYDGILKGEKRAEDLTSYTYGELGFIFRYMYGYPGRTGLDAGILHDQGLDKALEAAGEEGASLRKTLSSRDFRDFWFGMFEFSDGLMEDGHNSTSLEIGVVDAGNTEKYKDFREYTWKKLDGQKPSAFIRRIMQASSGIHSVRPTELEESKYYKYGDTAVILLDGFTVDQNSWQEYYRNGGELPEDTMGIAARGLKKASEDKEIRNVLFDLSTNPGGYSDAVAGVLSMMTGRDYLCGYNEQSGQSFKVYFDVDRNLDGKFDEEDSKVSYDFHYGVITSAASFSCGNLFPFLVRDEGGVVIGERSSGGSCSVQKAVLSEGFEIAISGCKFKLTDENGDELESGIKPDLTIEVASKKIANEITGAPETVPDYSLFGDMNGICESASGWFSK